MPASPKGALGQFLSKCFENLLGSFPTVDRLMEGPLITQCRLNYGQKKGAFVLLSNPYYYLYMLVLYLIGLHDFFALYAKMDGSFQ